MAGKVNVNPGVQELSISGAHVVSSVRKHDERGFFSELYNCSADCGATAKSWKQISLSESKPHVIRGIHVSLYGKLVTCIQGSMHDYIVDVRPTSPTYLLWNRVNLNAGEGKQVYIPGGCGHAFQAGETGCAVMYFQEGVFDPANEVDIAWNDPSINILWSIPAGIQPVISKKDRDAPLLRVVHNDSSHLTPRKRVLVLGASGQVGGALMECFKKESYFCIGTYNTNKIDAGYVFCDFEKVAEDETIAKELIEQVYPDIVCICSAFTWVDGCENQVGKAYAVNSKAPEIFAKAASQISSKVVFYSTDYVFDGHSGPYDESDLPVAINIYGSSKLEGEKQVLDAAPNALVIRTTGVYGPDRQQKNFVYQVMKNCGSGQSMQVPNDQLGNPTYNKDLAEATLQLLRANATGIINVVGPQVYDRFSFAMAIARDLHLDTSNLVGCCTADMCPRAPRPLSAGLKTEKICNVLPTFSMRSVSEALQDWNPRSQSFYSSTQATEPTKKNKVWYAPHTFQAYGEDEIKAVESCLRKGWLAPGPLMAEFETQVAAYFGKRHGVMVNSGSSANTLGLAVLDLVGKEVITPACTFSTCIAPMEQLGIKPVFVDVEVGRYVPTVDAILAAVTPNTGCIFIPNLVGSKPDWEDLRARLPRQDIVLFEDSCDTMTYTACTDISVISFYASHIITAGGCGGVVMFNDPKLAKKALMYRDWGRLGNNSEDMEERFGQSVDGIPYDFKFLYGVLGYNFKCCEMNAAFGLEQMKKLPTFTKIRSENIDRYVRNLKNAGTSFILPVDHEKYDWLALPLMVTSRPRIELLKYLEANDVQVRVCFAGNITRHPAYRHYLQDFPNSDLIMAQGFLLGAHHGLTLADVDRVCELLIRFDKKLECNSLY